MQPFKFVNWWFCKFVVLFFWCHEQVICQKKRMYLFWICNLKVLFWMNFIALGLNCKNSKLLKIKLDTFLKTINENFNKFLLVHFVKKRMYLLLLFLCFHQRKILHRYAFLRSWVLCVSCYTLNLSQITFTKLVLLYLQCMILLWGVFCMKESV